MQERGHKKNEILKQIEKRRKDAERHIHPQNDFADLVVHYFTDDEFSVGNSDVDFNRLVQDGWIFGGKYGKDLHPSYKFHEAVSKKVSAWISNS